MHRPLRGRGRRPRAPLSATGLLGGTFNPPHVAHLACALEAADQLGLERVLLLPAGSPPHKPVPADPGPQVRAELCRLAVEGEPRLGVCEVELAREGPSYTVDTLRALDAAGHGELTFIVGGDMALSLPGWREPEELLRLARLAVAERAGARRERIERRLAGLAGAGRVVFFAMPRLDVSSTDVRARVAAGRPYRHLVGPAVAGAIAERGLYR